MMEITAFAIFMGIFAIADMISTKTEARLPSLFTVAVLSIAGYWTGIIPTDLFELTGISSVLVYLIYYLQLANMGALIPIEEMLRQWKTILIALAGLIGVTIGAYFIGGLIFGSEAALMGAPALAGGIVAYEIMREGAELIGRSDLAIMALSIYVFQEFIGYPLTSFLLKKEANSLLKEFKLDSKTIEADSLEKKPDKKKLFPQLPKKYITTNTILFKLAIAGLIGIVITNSLNSAFKPGGGGDFISRYVVLLVVGFILNEVGFLDTAPIKNSQIGGFTAVVIVGFSIVSGLSSVTPEVLFAMLIPALGIIVTGCTGLIIISAIVGKFLGYSREMSIAIALSALYGYPGTEILSNEAVKVVAKTSEESEYLLENILPKMLIGGFTTVTFGSVFLAGILVKFI